jgi:hypothetical protein
MSVGVEELDQEKLTTLLRLKYRGSIADAVADLGKPDWQSLRGLSKVSLSNGGVIARDSLTKHWTDWVDYWAVDFDYESRKEIISVPLTAFSDGKLLGVVQPDSELVLYEDLWTGSYIRENEWQSFRTRSRELDLVSASHTYEKPDRYTISVKVIDIFGNHTMTLIMFPDSSSKELMRATELRQ